MRAIAVANRKGGVGKTTTSVNLAVALARAGRRVCLVDLDPQAHATLHVGVVPGSHPVSAYDLLAGTESLAAASASLISSRSSRRKLACSNSEASLSQTAAAARVRSAGSETAKECVSASGSKGAYVARIPRYRR